MQDMTDSPLTTAFHTGLKVREEPFYAALDEGAFNWKRVLWDGAPCAGKLIRSRGGAPKDKDAFFALVGKACVRWNQLRHPYVLQLFGMYRCPAEDLPVLVAELMGPDLASLLRTRDKDTLPLGVKARLLEQALLGLAHLHSHSPPLVHGSLSASKVVVDTKRWVGKLSECCLRGDGSTTVGGTVALFHSKEEETAYLPPEAYNELFTVEGDVFAYGVLVLHTIGHSLPLPAHSTQQGEDDVKMFSEFEARRHCLEFFSYSEIEQFQKIIQRCLRYSPEDRMDMKTLLSEVQSIEKSIVQEEDPPIPQRKQNTQNSDVERLQNELEIAVHRAISAEDQGREWQKEAAQAKEGAEKRIIAINEEKVVMLSAELESAQREKEEARAELKYLLERVEELEKDKASLTAVNEELLGRLREQDVHVADNNAPTSFTGLAAPLPGNPSQLHKVPAAVPSLKEGMQWCSGPDMPARLLAAAAVEVGGAIYIGGGPGEDSSLFQVYKLLLDTLQWLTLPLPQHRVMFFTLAGCGGSVHMLGGLYSPRTKPQGAKHESGLVLTFDEHAACPWVEKLPSMSTPRHSANAVSIGSYIVIAGGELGDKRLSSVEVIDTSVERPSWYNVGVLPEPMHGPRMVVWQDKLVIGLGIVFEFFRSSVYTIPVSKLLKKDLPITESLWNKLPVAPRRRSALAVICGQLVTIGGIDSARTPQAKCDVFDPRRKCWNEFSRLGVRRASTAAINTNQGIFVIGGVFSTGHCLTKTTEIGVLQYH